MRDFTKQRFEPLQVFLQNHRWRQKKKSLLRGAVVLDSSISNTIGAIMNNNTKHYGYIINSSVSASRISSGIGSIDRYFPSALLNSVCCCSNFILSPGLLLNLFQLLHSTTTLNCSSAKLLAKP